MGRKKKYILNPGDTYSDLTLIRIIGKGLNGVEIWECKCKCGNITTGVGINIAKGRKKSCGCHNKDSHYTHRMCKTRIYCIHRNMINRCRLACSVGFENYGGRNIKVCKEWDKKEGFDNFYKWAMENGYRDDLTLDRIDVNGDYTPDNCRWVTMKEQQNNRRNNHYLTYNGKTQSMKKWADEYNLPYSTFQGRIYRGWEIEKALKTPKMEVSK